MGVGTAAGAQPEPTEGPPLAPGPEMTQGDWEQSAAPKGGMGYPVTARGDQQELGALIKSPGCQVKSPPPPVPALQGTDCVCKQPSVSQAWLGKAKWPWADGSPQGPRSVEATCTRCSRAGRAGVSAHHLAFPEHLQAGPLERAAPSQLSLGLRCGQ